MEFIFRDKERFDAELHKYRKDSPLDPAELFVDFDFTARRPGFAFVAWRYKGYPIFR